jgi:Predicted metal-dependent hydrolase of the TIM-barrel fold
MSTFTGDDYFKIDPEAHLVGDMGPLLHYPGVQMWWRSIDGIKRALNTAMPARCFEGFEPHEMKKDPSPEGLLAAMDKYGVDIACVLPESMMDTTGYSSRWCTNGEMAKVVEAHPDRFMYQPNVSPIKHRGVKNSIWELEYWVKEKGAKIFKFYPPEDTYINDPDLWPFYEKAEQLGIVLDIHTGFSWVPPGKSKYAQPLLLDDVARDFPNLTLVAFHMGYPQCDELNMVAMGHPNVYLCLSLLIPWALNAPRKFAHILGEALRFAGPDRIIWGTDTPGFAFQVRWSVEGLREFQIPEDMQEGYGYPALTDDDRRKVFGGNLAGLLGVDTSKRRVATDGGAPPRAAAR